MHLVYVHSIIFIPYHESSRSLHDSIRCLVVSLKSFKSTQTRTSLPGQVSAYESNFQNSPHLHISTLCALPLRIVRAVITSLSLHIKSLNDPICCLAVCLKFDRLAGTHTSLLAQVSPSAMTILDHQLCPPRTMRTVTVSFSLHIVSLNDPICCLAVFLSSSCSTWTRTSLLAQMPINRTSIAV